MYREDIHYPLSTPLSQFQVRNNISDRVGVTKKLSACTSVDGMAVKKPMAPLTI
jgi:hypothetical protein